MWNSCLPEDVLVHILIRLPPKSLGRCKSVSKSWNVAISSSEFIRFHLQYQYQSSIRNKLYRLLTKVVDYRPEEALVEDYSHQSHETHLAEYSINGENLELGCEIQRLYNPYERHAPGMRSMLVGSCNGLLCQILCDGLNLKQHSIYGEYEISLCNPLTKSTRVLPKSPLSSLKDEHRVVFYGFGYDDVHDTYKVFLASGPPHGEYQYSLPDAKYEYQVYSLRTNKWIIVSSDLDYFHDYFLHCQDWNLDGVLIDCALHWILNNPYGPNQNKNKNYLLAFDLRSDKHKILPLPENVEDEYYHPLLSELNGCLLLSDDSIIRFEPEFNFDVWVMKDYGLRDSWTRIRIRSSPYYFSNRTLVALLEDHHHHHHHHYRRRKFIYHDINVRNGTILLYYNTASHRIVEFRTPPCGTTFYKVKQLQFVGSLVQPHPPSFGDKKIYTRVKKTILTPSPKKKLRTSSCKNMLIN